MTICFSCSESYGHDSPVTLVTYKAEGVHIKSTVHQAICSHLCARSYVEKELLNQTEASFGIFYEMQLEMCTQCGNFTHPTEFCEAPYDVRLAFESLSYNGQLTYMSGYTVSLTLSEDMYVHFKYVDTSCDVYKIQSDSVDLALFQERAPLIYLQDSGKDIRYYIESILNTPIDTDHVYRLHKQLITDFQVVSNHVPPPGDLSDDESSSSSDMDLSTVKEYTELVFHHVVRVKDMFKLYLPHDILSPTCAVPIEKYEYESKVVSYDGHIDFAWDYFQGGLPTSPCKLSRMIDKEFENFNAKPLINEMPMREE